MTKQNLAFQRNVGSIFAFLNAYYPKTQLIKALNYLDSSRTYIRLLGDPKTGCLRELFVPENGFKTCSAAHFPKEHPKFGGWPGNQSKTKFKLEFFPHDLLLINSI